MPLKIAFHTLGCKLNQLETESIADAFGASGALVLSPDAGEEAASDIIVINSCTVTTKAEQKARRIIRLALASSARTVVVVTGCYAEVEASSLAAMGERVVVLPGGRKELLLELPSALAESGIVAAGGDAQGRALLDFITAFLGGAEARVGVARDGALGRFAFNPESFAFHSRPSLKIQDGCDNACAYCRVHIARGASTSLPAAVALERAQALEAAGRAEIVLAGVNLSQYRDGDLDFPGLLRMLIAGTGRIAFRISSYEPDKLNGAFVEAFAEKRVRPHVHLALQSGSDSVLSAMGRKYDAASVRAAVGELRRVKGDPFLAADIIAGFPSESESDAEATLELARDCGFAWIHAFRFSPRPGTTAASMPRRVSERVAGERAAALLELGRSGRADYIGRWVGREVDAVLEGDLCATTENYLKLKIEALPEGASPGQGIRCRIGIASSVEVTREIDGNGQYITNN
jgi:threonylcarbamoyladenosine tRNA methylthiotransferase MtaB